jgi:hypothetical protein
LHRRLRIAAPFAAMTLAAGLALGGTAVATAGVQGQHARPAGMAGAGRTASRAAVPWSLVGPGWALVTYTTATLYAARPEAGATTLYLVDPAGGKYVLYQWPHVPADGGVELLAWSGDGTRAMLEVATGPAGSVEQLDQLTLATGTLTRLRLPASVFPVGYTRPDGLAVLAYRSLVSPPEVQLARYSLSGGLEKVLVTQQTTGNGGGIDIGQSSPYNPDGTAMAVTATPDGVSTAGHTVLVSNAGGVIRRFTSADSCLVVHWWTASELLTGNCAGQRLFVTPVSGASPVPLTPAPLTLAAGSPYRFPEDAWQLAGHVYVQLTGPACGTGSLAVIRGGRLADVPVRTGDRGATIVAASTSELLIVAEGCMRSSGLLWFNPADSAQVQVLGPNQGLGVLGLVPYYQVNGG